MRLIVFSQVNCVPCKILKLYLQANGVECQERSVDELGIFGLSIMAAPVLLLTEEDMTPVDFVVGFNPSNPSDVDKLIAKKNRQ